MRIYTKSFALLKYSIENYTIKPDHYRQPLMDLPIPKDIASLRRALERFAQYCFRILSFSEKIRSLLAKGHFPLTKDAEKAFSSL